jgi:hydrogenase maturation protease
MEKNTLILCTGHPYATDAGLGYHVFKVLENMKLPENVECMEIGESASMIPSFVEGRDKLIVIDVLQTQDKPGTVLRLKPEEVPLVVDGFTDVAKFHLMEMLGHIKLIGKYPETVFIGVVPNDVRTEGEHLTPEVEKKIPEVIDLILKEIT